MGMIFVGLMFLMLELDVSSGNTVISLLPDVAGFILLLIGLQKLKSNSHYFPRAIGFSVGLIPAAAIHFAAGAFGISRDYPTAFILLGLLCIVGRFLVSLWVVQGLRDMEAKDDVQLYSTQLFWVWLSYVVISTMILPVELIAGVVPQMQMACQAAALILGLCFMLFFYRSMRAFEEAYEFQ